MSCPSLEASPPVFSRESLANLFSSCPDTFECYKDVYGEEVIMAP